MDRQVLTSAVAFALDIAALLDGGTRTTVILLD
jgi:hypothetical protein